MKTRLLITEITDGHDCPFSQHMRFMGRLKSPKCIHKDNPSNRPIKITHKVHGEIGDCSDENCPLPIVNPEPNT